MIWKIADLLKAASETWASRDGRTYTPARPLPGPLSTRIKAAWLVLTGQADAVIWPAP